MTQVFAIVGVVMQLVGIAIAVAGVASAHREIADSPLWRTVASDALSLVRRRRGVVHRLIGTAGVSLSVGHADLRVRPAPLHDGASVQEQLDHLRRHLEAVDTELQGVPASIRREVREATALTNERLAEFSEELSLTRADVEKVQSASFGPGGKGLRITAIGLAVTGVGTALSAAPLLP